MEEIDAFYDTLQERFEPTQTELWRLSFITYLPKLEKLLKLWPT